MKQAIKANDATLAKHQKKNLELQKKLKEFAAMYNLIHNERNKNIGLIQTTSQRASETQEEMKILENEIEFLRTIILNEEREVQENKFKETNNNMICGSFQRVLTKVALTLQVMRQKKVQQKLVIGKLIRMFNQTVDSMMQLRRKRN